MSDNILVIISTAAVIGFVWVIAWLLKRISRGEIGISVSTAVLALLAAILLVPFGMNFSAHLISSIANRSGDTENSVTQHEHDLPPRY